MRLSDARPCSAAGHTCPRHILAARTRAEPRVVGYADVLDEHPEDGYSWLGAIEIHAHEQRRSFGRQCVEAIAQRARADLNARVLRAAADVDDLRAQAFLTSLTFVSVDTRDRSSPQGRVPVTVYEKALAQE